MTRSLATLALACLLSACSTGMDAVVGTLRSAMQGEPGPDPARLNPNFRYLRVTVEGRVAFLALGYVDSHPHGPVEVWYSAKREALRLQGGRLVGATGLTTEWRSVELPELPSWSAIARAGEPVQWERVRDVMPGYRFGVRDALVLRAIAPPGKSALQGLDPKSLAWFEERFRDESRPGLLAALGAVAPDAQVLPPARYAVELREGRETVVYGEQCVSADLCFTWQRWAVKP